MSITLNDIELKNNQSNSRKKPFLAEKGVKYPQLIGEKGEKPMQYLDYDKE